MKLGVSLRGQLSNTLPTKLYCTLRRYIARPGWTRINLDLYQSLHIQLHRIVRNSFLYRR